MRLRWARAFWHFLYSQIFLSSLCLAIRWKGRRQFVVKCPIGLILPQYTFSGSFSPASIISLSYYYHARTYFPLVFAPLCKKRRKITSRTSLLFAPATFGLNSTFYTIYVLACACKIHLKNGIFHVLVYFYRIQKLIYQFVFYGDENLFKSRSVQIDKYYLYSKNFLRE